MKTIPKKRSRRKLATLFSGLRESLMWMLIHPLISYLMNSRLKCPKIINTKQFLVLFVKHLVTYLGRVRA
nr:hypothetical protein Iba_chr03aCG12330 [Ipomoea batatas]GMC74500.1 hypothetical protein Iba_chr03cCG10840 [Ipomoea batatas]GMC75532.1 hypothetical protein Iba_chr03dCG5870 [Ipomoea batatas]GMC76414.1 hypothetical protein Iba_chr03eCG0940 [Ipomoea batatas]